MEHKRKSLLATQVKWGAPVGSAGSASTPSDAASRLDALIMADPEKRVIRIPRIRPPFSAAAFGSSLDDLIASSPNFKAVPRVQYTSNSDVNVRQSAQPGVPVVVEGLHNHPSWNTELFSPDWLLDKSGIAAISARNVHTRTDQEIPLVEFLAKTRAMSHLAVGGEQERLYGKDVPCPAKYRKFLHEAGVVDPSMAPDGQNLLKNLPKNEQPETLMCYLGVGDTFTPAHTDLCASQGHNLMTYTENDGSSWWFMTASANAWAVRDYFHRVLKNDLDHESHIVTLDELRKAPFPVYITKQKLGDLVLVPPRSAHQVVNAGGLTIKTSWSRMTLDGLALALRYELPLYRRVCRTETYRVKSTIYHTLLRTIDDVKANKGGSKESGKNLLKLLPLFDLMLVDEYAEPTDKVTVLPSADDSEDGDGSNSTQFTCDFCGADIWQAFFECRNCVSGARKPVPKGTGFHICPGCYTEGRSCECSSMSPLLCRPWKALVDVRKAAMSALLQVSTATSVPRQLKELLSKKKGIFRAALLLLKRRTELAGDSSKHCTVARDTAFNHEEAAFQLLRCKPCHSAMCFAHALHERYIHSTNALFAHTEDETHDVFHKAHRTCRITYEQSLPLLKKEELRSPFPDPFAQLACLARTYTTCRPVAPQLKWKSGFYDFTVTITESDTDVEAVAPPPASTMVPSAAQPPPPPRKVRYILDYVAVPPMSRPPPTKRTDNLESNRIKAKQNLPDKLKETEPATAPKRKRNAEASTSTLAPKHKRRREIIVLDEDSDSPSPPPAKERVPLSSLKFKKRTTASVPVVEQSASASIADAYNFAGTQNQMPSEDDDDDVLPKRPAKRRRLPPPTRQLPPPTRQLPPPSAPSSESSGPDISNAARKRKRPSRFAPAISIPPSSSSSSSSATSSESHATLKEQVRHLQASVDNLSNRQLAQMAQQQQQQQQQQQIVAAPSQIQTTTEVLRFVGDLFKSVLPHIQNMGMQNQLLQNTWPQSVAYSAYPPPPIPAWASGPPPPEYEQAAYSREGYRTHGYAQYPRPRNVVRRRRVQPEPLNVELERRSWNREDHEQQQQQQEDPVPRKRRRTSSRPPTPVPDEHQQEQQQQQLVSVTLPEPIPAKRFPLPARERAHTPTQDWEDTYEHEEPSA